MSEKPMRLDPRSGEERAPLVASRRFAWEIRDRESAALLGSTRDPLRAIWFSRSARVDSKLSFGFRW